MDKRVVTARHELLSVKAGDKARRLDWLAWRVTLTVGQGGSLKIDGVTYGVGAVVRVGGHPDRLLWYTPTVSLAVNVSACVETLTPDILPHGK